MNGQESKLLWEFALSSGQNIVYGQVGLFPDEVTAIAICNKRAAPAMKSSSP